MLDHLGLQVSDYDKSKRFYATALAPLGYTVIMEFGGNAAGLGADGRPDFWIAPGKPAVPIHIAFASPDRATVEAFYKAALAAGGRDNGGPGLRPQYHANYYGAFVFDPDGNNVEAVCHRAE
ncbi:MAG: VOC family protein [Deltaproteobacteria bacterium]|nr:VOC family protein [Deltaproteobacteria bacterium]